MKRAFLLSVSALALAACSQTQATQAQWTRIDGSIGKASEFEQAKIICGNRADAAAEAATASRSIGYGTADAIASGIASGIAQANVKKSTILSCMAERGYRLEQQ